MNNKIFKNLFVLELANNHWGDLERGKEIIRQFAKVVKDNINPIPKETPIIAPKIPSIKP